MDVARDRGVTLRRTAFFVQQARAMPQRVMAAGAAVHIAVVAILADAGLAMWRVGAVIGLFAAFTGHQIVVRRKPIDDRCVESTLLAVNVGAQLLVVGSSTLTGGVHS